MSLALVAYGRELGTRVELVGLDSNPGVIETVRGVADTLGYDEASFEATAIVDYASEAPVDLLVSLHACDTATDEAIAAGVRLGADAIVVAPCCHHELAGQIATGGKDALLRHGLLLGRQADLVTDALRASALEMLGYRVDVIEFVSAEHTAKNVMLRAEHCTLAVARRARGGRVSGAARPLRRPARDRAPARSARIQSRLTSVLPASDEGGMVDGDPLDRPDRDSGAHAARRVLARRLVDRSRGPRVTGPR